MTVYFWIAHILCSGPSGTQVKQPYSPENVPKVVFRNRKKIIKGNFFILQLDFVVSRCQIESYQNVSCMMSHLDLSCADDMLILIDLKFCLFRGSFGSFFGLFEGLSLLCWWFWLLIGPLTHPIDARLLPGKVEKHRKGWITRDELQKLISRGEL